MSKETIQKELCKRIITMLYDKKTINGSTYKQAMKNIEKEKRKEIA